ncbi:NADH-quinone oxidoreductase subunit I [Candidatus Providencia siddallii]|uniref:NADH-quinone oxidoreductase subunit I n=1 Tax=Candidatus Providencia siddallii TaxID=1715285 RepID=A0A0M6W918_9GAMM|nr:NADH-quinone oxidoreductase subunit I [Candidatus Providencia siddallii]
MIFKDLLIGFATQIRSISMIAFNAFRKRETQMYPEENVYLSPRYRGRVVLTHDHNGKERCVACSLCSVVCPASCIYIERAVNSDGRCYSKIFRINFSRCVFCGLCEEACPTTAIQLIPDFEMAEWRRCDLVYEKNDLLISGTGKYSYYDFYQKSGVVIDGKKKGDADNESNPIDIKELLP